MAASVDRRLRALVLVPCLLALAGLAGCNTTQDQNLRLGLRAQRTVASRTPVEVKRANPEVKVVRVTALRDRGGGAVAVTLRNDGDQIANDLPIEVGVGGEVLNSTPKTPYFQSRIPVLAPGEETTWVYATKDPLGAGAPFARVGLPADPPLTVADRIPDLEVSHHAVDSKQGPTKVEVEVANNDPDAPQYDLEVYAWARKGGRIVAAGRGVIEHVGTGESESLSLTLTGDPQGSEVQVSAPPTLFE